MTDYEVCIMVEDDAEECFIIRTEKNKDEIRQHYKSIGCVVTGISECHRTKNQEVPQLR